MIVGVIVYHEVMTGRTLTGIAAILLSVIVVSCPERTKIIEKRKRSGRMSDTVRASVLMPKLEKTAADFCRGEIAPVIADALQQMGLLCCSFFRKPRIHKILIRNPCVKLPGFLEDILKKFKALFFKDGISFPGILLFVTFHNDLDLFGVCLLKLRFDRLGDLCGGVGIHVVEAFWIAVVKLCMISGCFSI